jgi:hypothetical protein
MAKGVETGRLGSRTALMRELFAAYDAQTNGAEDDDG